MVAIGRESAERTDLIELEWRLYNHRHGVTDDQSNYASTARSCQRDGNVFHHMGGSAR